MANKIQINGTYERIEATADGAVTPGQLVEYTSAGKWKRSTVSGVLPLLAVAIENKYYSSDNVTAGIDDDYADEDVVLVNVPGKGSKVQVRVANGESIAIGDYLVSNGDGDFKERTSEATALLMAVSACDMSDSSAADPDNLVEAIVL